MTYVRKRKDLVQSYGDKTVNGIILNVTQRVLRTPSVIIDALLGQGEALDCYNEELQEAAVIAAQLANRKPIRRWHSSTPLPIPPRRRDSTTTSSAPAASTPQTETSDTDG